MHIVIIGILVVALIVGPGLWVKRILARYSEPADRYPEDGATVARRLLKELNISDVAVESTELGDHYDPVKRVVRLHKDRFAGHSLTAVTVAAHEVGHAEQHATGYQPLLWRTRLVQWVGPVEKLGAGLLMITPVLALLTRAPSVGILSILGGLMALAAGAVIHFVTLPTEWDASFARALPNLKRSKTLHEGDERHARRLLTAAAMTYVSASLLSLVNMARWWAILRR